MKKKVLLTGGTGFLGRNLALKLKEQYDVILTGRNNKQNLFAKNFTGCNVHPMDISNIESVRDVFNEVKPDIVIHCAATKFVDLSEKFPMECVDINILGSQNVARVAFDKEVDYVIGISTDKAANPYNIYGMTKCIMERLFSAMNGKGKTKFACVRYGNVTWSTGSVLPIWDKMHKETGVIKTSGADMRRFFFTIDHAVNLVVTAMDNIDKIQGQILSREMKSAKMLDILETWIKYKGGSIERIEGRPGDKIDECLIADSELPYTTIVEYNNIKHFIISPNIKSLEPVKEIFHSGNATRLTEQEILDIINNPPLDV
jgi:UDP-N-acetylglucosamine 4,6-dehydratase/5-epimerase